MNKIIDIHAINKIIKRKLGVRGLTKKNWHNLSTKVLKRPDILQTECRVIFEPTLSSFLALGLFLWLLLLCTPKASAQFIIDFSPKASRFPRELVKVEQINQSSSNIRDQFQFDIADSSVETTDNTLSIDLSYLYFSRSTKNISYLGFESATDIITSGNSYSITKKDLPAELSKDYGYVGFPVWIGEGKFNLFFGQLTSTDGEEVTEEDRIRFIDVEYYLTPEEDSTWLFGWYYADAFGGIYNVPFVGYVSETNTLFAVNLVIPVKWSVDVAFENGWILGIGQQVEGEAYRLTEKEPWNSAIMSFSGVKSIAAIGYHFSSGWYIRIEAGTMVRQKIHFYEDSISVSAAEVSEEAYLTDDIPLMELSLADSSFIGISLAWAF